MTRLWGPEAASMRLYRGMKSMKYPTMWSEDLSFVKTGHEGYIECRKEVIHQLKVVTFVNVAERIGPVNRTDIVPHGESLLTTHP